MIPTWIARLFSTAPTPSDLELAGYRAISRAYDQWEHPGVYDPKRTDKTPQGQLSRAAIDRYIRTGLGWTWEPPYAGDGDYEWCGAFAAWCWDRIRPELRKTYFSSTYRLDRYARYQSVNGERNKGAGRLIAELDEHSDALPWESRAGDILLIGPEGSGYGKHICLVEWYDAPRRVFRTIEGNGTGTAPNGDKWQGVVRGARHLGGPGWHARRLIRPSAEDLT